MVQAIPATEVTLRELRQMLGLVQAQSVDFFSEWTDVSVKRGEIALGEAEKALLDRVKANYLELMEAPPMLENTVKDGGISTIARPVWILSSPVSD